MKLIDSFFRLFRGRFLPLPIISKTFWYYEVGDVIVVKTNGKEIKCRIVHMAHAPEAEEIGPLLVIPPGRWFLILESIEKEKEKEEKNS